MNKQQMKQLEKFGLIFGEYQGKPTLSFKENVNDNFPFSFGRAKAKKLLAVMRNVGPEQFLETLEDFCNG